MAPLRKMEKEIIQGEKKLWENQKVHENTQ